MGYVHMKIKQQIPFHMNADKTFTIFYDEEKKLFYRKYTKVKTDPIYMYSGIFVTLIYPLVSGVTYRLFSHTPILPVGISFLAAVVFLYVTMYLVEKQFNQTDIYSFNIPDEDYLYTLIVEGERQLQTYRSIVIGSLVLNLCLMAALFTYPNEFVLFLCHTIFWWVFFVLLTFSNLFKRKKLYRQLRSKIE